MSHPLETIFICPLLNFFVLNYVFIYLLKTFIQIDFRLYIEAYKVRVISFFLHMISHLSLQHFHRGFFFFVLKFLDKMFKYILIIFNGTVFCYMPFFRLPVFFMDMMTKVSIFITLSIEVVIILVAIVF